MTRVRRSTKFSLRFGARRFFWTTLVVVAFSTGFTVAQSTGESSTGPTDGGALFVPSLDVDSPNVFSSVDAARRNRPPKPTKVKEDLFYPDDFLTLSEETLEPEASETPSKNAAGAQTPVRPLNPSVETTPIGPPPEPETPKKSRGDQILFFATSIALAALGVFVYFDYRYRDQLKTNLARNARLCSPGAVAADFADVLAKDDGTFVDASYVDPNLDAPSFLFDGANVANSLNSANLDRFVGDMSENAGGFNAVGANLKEENFDFIPTASPTSLPEPQEDFVVGENATAR